MNKGDFNVNSSTWPGLSKLIEEAGEVIQVCGKLIATAGADIHYDSSNLRERLQDELGDLKAAVQFVINMNELDADAISERTSAKLELYAKWREET